MRRWSIPLRACALLALVAVGCHKEQSTKVASDDGCDGARCVEAAEAALWDGRDDEAREPLSLVCEEQNDGFQCFRLGQLYHQGRGGPADPAKAAELYEKACGLDVDEACEARYELAREGQGGDAVELEYSIKACDVGRSRGCLNGADLRLTGRGVKADRDQAIELYEKACSQGEAEGCNSAGDLLYDPAASNFDKARALAAYISGCTGNTGYGCLRVGVAFHDGVGAERNPEKALQHFKRACEYYDDDGCHNAKLLEAAKGKDVDLELTSTVSMIDADGLAARDFSCRMGQQGAAALRDVLAQVAARKAALDACAEEGAAINVSWTFTNGRVRDAKVHGQSSKKQSSCVTNALRKAAIPESGSCKGVLLVGDPDGAAKALAARSESGKSPSSEVRLSTKKQRAPGAATPTPTP